MGEPHENCQWSEQLLAPCAQYLSHPDTPYDCWFNVGDPKKIKSERIGGSKLHLMAHSVLFRRMLHESPLAEKGAVNITDMEPTTFRHFLRFVHGHYDVTDLSIEESVALLCAAEKYFVDDLKRRLGEHISSIVDVDNVCLPISTLECHGVKQLNNAMEKIVQEETKKLVDTDEFLKLNTVGVVYIVTQECLQIDEVELWNAVLKWAKHTQNHQAFNGFASGSRNQTGLRKILLEPLKHIRFCAMHCEDFIKQVVVWGILTGSEVLSVVKTFGWNSSDYCIKSPHISYDTNVRCLFSHPGYLPCVVFPSHGFRSSTPKSKSYMYITTGNKSIQLVSAMCDSQPHPLSQKCVPYGLTYRQQCKVILTRITDYENDTSAEDPVEVDIEEVVSYDDSFTLDFGPSLKLLPQNKYRLIFSTNGVFTSSYAHKIKGEIVTCKDFRISWDLNDFPAVQFYSLKYQTLKN